MLKRAFISLLSVGLASALAAPAAYALGETSAGALPSSYFLTNEGFVTSVKLQDPWGSCWAFAIASAIESSILKAESQVAPSLEESMSESSSAEIEATLDSVPLTPSSAEAPRLSGLTDTIDLSERAIAWWGHELQTEASGGSQKGEGYYLLESGDWAQQLSSGSFPQVESQLVTGQSLLLEESVPYQYNGYVAGESEVQWFDSGSYDGAWSDARTQDWSVTEDLRVSEEVGWRIAQVYQLPDPAIVSTNVNTGFSTYEGYDADATRAIKQALLDVGAVAIAIEAESSIPREVTTGEFQNASPSEHFTYSTWSQFNGASEIRDNHAVCIVGWDDDYSLENFAGTESGAPMGNGAWLCKNNWGSDELYAALDASDNATHWGLVDEEAGSTGFFWVSYYDHSITFPVAFGVAPVLGADQSLYQYDYLAVSEFNKPSIYSNSVKVANLFTAEKTELIEEVTAWTFGENETVTTWIYTLPDGIDPTSMEATALFEHAQLAATTIQTLPYAGYHTLELDAPIIVNKGHSFIVAQEVQLPDGADAGDGVADEDAAIKTYLSLEMAFTENIEGNPQPTMAAVVANPGESFVSISKDEWMTTQEYNDWYVNLKSQGGTPVDLEFGNALTKALTRDTTLDDDGQIIKLVELDRD